LRSVGQLALLPSQYSAGSHSPVESRHRVPTGETGAQLPLWHTPGRQAAPGQLVQLPPPVPQ
jgi:hypothetical protein